MALTFVLPPSLGAAKAAARAELIEAALGRELGEPIVATVAGSYAELERQALAGDADLVWAPAAVCCKLPAASAVFTIVRGGAASYRSALVAASEHELAVTGLHGLRAAWVDPLSAGGYLLILAFLRARGIDPERTFARQRFLGSHRAAVEAVLLGTADVAAVSVQGTDAGSVAETLRWYVGPAAGRLGAIAVSESCPNDAIVLGARVPAPVVERFRAAVAKGRSRLLSVLEADRLDPAELDDYRRVRALLGLEPSSSRSLPPGATRRTERPR